MAITNTVDPESGTITSKGDLERTKANHSNMPHRTDAYHPTDDRGHVTASSTGGSNNPDNITPQARDLNRSGGSYYNMEAAERDVLENGGSIHSEKTAFVSNQPGGRSDAFISNDEVTFANGHTQTVNLSFENQMNAEQESYNAALNDHVDMLNDPNPGDDLRASMSTEEYAELMEETDACLPTISDMYQEWDYQGTPSGDLAADSTDWNYDASDSIGIGAAAEADADIGVAADDAAGIEAGADDDAGADLSDDD